MIVRGTASRIPLQAGIAQCVVTSPPYYRVRKYGTTPQVLGGHPNCAHEWQHNRYYSEQTASSTSSEAFSEPGKENAARVKRARWSEDATCIVCGAWLGELGSEPTVAMYVEHMVDVFREVWRVLRDDGTLWLNIGDSYNAAGRTGHGTREGRKQGTARAAAFGQDNIRSTEPSLKHKDLLMVPARIALALQADGWYLRSDIIWEKPDVMPGPANDRPVSSYDHIFLLTKHERYIYNADAIREKTGKEATAEEYAKAKERTWKSGGDMMHAGSLKSKDARCLTHPLGRGCRNVWRFATESVSDAHFATFPEELPERCILAGSRTGDLVFDPFLGSGTTGRVADRLGRRWVGLELSSPYVEIIKRRTAGCGQAGLGLEI